MTGSHALAAGGTFGRAVWVIAHSAINCPVTWDFPFADSKVAILPDFDPISKLNDHADDKCLFSSAMAVHCLLQECCGECLRPTRRSSNRLLVEIVMFFSYRDTQTRRSTGGGTPNR